MKWGTPMFGNVTAMEGLHTRSVEEGWKGGISQKMHHTVLRDTACPTPFFEETEAGLHGPHSGSPHSETGTPVLTPQRSPRPPPKNGKGPNLNEPQVNELTWAFPP